jgi:hypothetical protein
MMNERLVVSTTVLVTYSSRPFAGYKNTYGHETDWDNMGQDRSETGAPEMKWYRSKGKHIVEIQVRKEQLLG